MNKEERLNWCDKEIAKTEKLVRSNDGDMADRWKLEQLREERERSKGGGK